MNLASRHQIVRRLTARLAENHAEEAINLWEQVAKQIVSIIGESGFDSLYARSLSLTSATFPWLSPSATSTQFDYRFGSLRTSLEAQTPVLASEANGLLMITFTDLLASLIGEPLTARILDSAWGRDRQRADKEGDQS